jgi:DNA-binding response OmpR family regulator
VLRRIQSDFPTVKVIAIAGGGTRGQYDSEKNMVLLGAAKSLAKPFTRAELVKAVEEVLRRG